MQREMLSDSFVSAYQSISSSHTMFILLRVVTIVEFQPGQTQKKNMLAKSIDNLNSFASFFLE